MESASRDLTENASTNGTSQVISDCLATSVVLRRILQHFSSAELLTLSLVNKQWNYEARCLIRDRGTYVANLCQYSSRDIAQLATDLEKMNVVPLSGLRISLYATDNIYQLVLREGPAPVLSAERGASIHYNILNRLPLKYFHVKIEHGFWKDYQQNTSFMLVLEALRCFCRVFEDFAILNYSNERHTTFEATLLYCFFPSLKKFSFAAPGHTSRNFTNFFKVMVARAPNLQELHTDLGLLRENVLEGTSAVLVPPIEDFDPLDEEAPEFIADMIRLNSLNLVQFDWSFSVRRCNRTIPPLLQASRTSLKSLSIDTLTALLIISYGIRLENVTELAIHMNYSLQWVGTCVLMQQAVDFTTMFPKLHQVTIHNITYERELIDLRKFVGQVSDALKKPLPNRAANIDRLTLDDCLNSYTAAIYASMFPDIQSLFVESRKEEAIPYGFIWNSWPDLKGITVVKTSLVQHIPRIENLDSLFCGLFAEEVAELREKDDEYLKRVNIVPIAPSITSLKHLKRFRYIFRWMNYLGVQNNDDSTSALGDFGDPTYVFSKVTGLIAFARCPYLSVTLETDMAHMERALSHMKPYASVVITRECAKMALWYWWITMNSDRTNGCLYDGDFIIKTMTEFGGGNQT